MDVMANTTSDFDNQPVTVSVARKIRPGQEQAYEAWIKGVSAEAAKYPGHLGVGVLRPSKNTNDEYVLIYRFDTFEHGRTWEESPERKAWAAKLDGIAANEATFQKVTGLEFWFDLPAVPMAAKPSPHKMALVLVVAVFSLIYPMQVYLAPLLSDLAMWGRVLCIVILQVLMLTYIVMPRVTKLLKPWLYNDA